MKLLASYLGGAWQAGSGRRIALVNPATEEAIAEVSAEGFDLALAFADARGEGRRNLAAMTFGERGALLSAMAKAIHGAREELIALAVQNGGNTRGDAKFDIDGASGTLSYYAGLGAELGNKKILVDGDSVQVGRTARMGGQHVWVTRRGVAVHINAFNFPAWGLAEKAACALLAGMPVISKPATATCLVTHRVMELLAPIVPRGALQLLCGPAGGLIEHVIPGDVVAFTGSSGTAKVLRAHPAIVANAVRLNVEADSLNTAVLGPDVELGSEAGQLFLADVARDMTQKTGQKCTAIRRVLVPGARRSDVLEALADKLGAIAVGDPAREDVRMGPVATAQQHADVKAGIARLAAVTDAAYGGTGDITPIGGTAGKGYFVGPVLRTTANALGCAPLHEHEVFGPVATVAEYGDDLATPATFIAMGEGCLVTSLYSNDRDWLAATIRTAAPWNGRIYIGSDKMAAQSPGPGTALPQLLHGGPGRAGEGTELGGLRGLELYMQRSAFEGDTSLIKSLL